MASQPWWKGSRGEGYVVAQAGLFLLIGLGLSTWSGLPAWPGWLSRVGLPLGGMLIGAGALLALAGLVYLGANLTPLPYPKDDTRLVARGVYRLARHPIYGGLILAAFGWALWRQGWLTLGYVVLLFLLFDRKAAQEEAWLQARFPQYEAYRRRVRKFIPFLY